MTEAIGKLASAGPMKESEIDQIARIVVQESVDEAAHRMDLATNTRRSLLQNQRKRFFTADQSALNMPTRRGRGGLKEQFERESEIASFCPHNGQTRKCLGDGLCLQAAAGGNLKSTKIRQASEKNKDAFLGSKFAVGGGENGVVHALQRIKGVVEKGGARIENKLTARIQKIPFQTLRKSR